MPKIATLKPPRQSYVLALASGAVLKFVKDQPVRVADDVVPLLRRVTCNRGHASFEIADVPDHSDVERMLGVQLKFPAVAAASG